MRSEKKHPRQRDTTKMLDASLAEAAERGDAAPFLLALRRAAQTDGGGISAVAKRAGLNRANLHEALAGRANPRVTTVLAVLESLGYRLTVEEINEG